MTNTLVGDVYQKVIEEVVLASANDFEESGVSQATLNELRQAWQAKLSLRGVAQMPWDPKPEPVPRTQHGHMPPANGVPPSSYQGYGDEAASMSNGLRVKQEPVDQYTTAQQPGGYAPVGPQQGGIARAQELVQERFGQQAAAAIQRPGLALPGQQQQKPALQLPGQSQEQQRYAQAQHQMMQRQQQQHQQQQALQAQQMAPRIKVEQDSPSIPQEQFAAQQQRPAYAQTDGADDYAEWQAYITQRRALHNAQVENNDHMMRDRISALSHELESGLMVPLDLQHMRAGKRRHMQRVREGQPGLPTTHNPQTDGVDDDDELVKETVKPEEDDDDAINSDLDDPDDDQNPIGDDEDDLGDSILCTYDKVQRVKNKWKCTLKDGVLNTGGKEWLFHKGQGEFECEALENCTTDGHAPIGRV